MSTSPRLDKYTVGTLKYNFVQLLMVCTIMMLSRHALSIVCYVIVPTIQPLLLDKLGSNATQIALITGTIPSILNFVLCPLISTLSDKTRTRHGRRIPYLVWSAPVLALILSLMGCTVEIANFLGRIFSFVSWNWGLVVFGTLAIAFQIVFLFPGSVFYYLEADVIPQKCFGQYMGIASMTSSLCGAAFSYFLLKPTVDHMKPMLLLFGCIYFGIYFLQFLFVREGDYPPVEKVAADTIAWHRKTANYLAMFFRQCFGQKIYILLALCTGFNAASNICRGMFGMLFATKDLQLDVGVIGKSNAIGSLVSASLIYFCGRLMDKTHPMLIYFIGGLLVMIVNVFGYYCVYDEKTFIIIAIVTKLMYAFQGLASTPLMVKLLPMDKFGQYASANAMVNSIVLMIGSVLGGIVTNRCGYRVMFVWDFLVTGLAMWCLVIVYKEWKRHGGKEYQAPQVS